MSGPDYVNFINSLIDKMDTSGQSMGVQGEKWIDHDLVALDELLVEAAQKQEFSPFIKDDPLSGRQVRLLFNDNHKYIAHKMQVINKVLRKHHEIINQYKGVAHVVKGFDFRLKNYIDTLISSRSINSDRIGKLEKDMEHLQNLVDIQLRKFR